MINYDGKMKQIAVLAFETYIDGNSSPIPFFWKGFKGLLYQITLHVDSASCFKHLFFHICPCS